MQKTTEEIIHALEDVRWCSGSATGGSVPEAELFAALGFLDLGIVGLVVPCSGAEKLAMQKNSDSAAWCLANFLGKWKIFLRTRTR